ncbi:MAG TPA: MFS transporter, partial [Patescibacteria group bacterium]|nr:MFS transporter [Patescibacteria group bacterium]
MAIFTRHIDKEHEGVEWGVYRTMIDFGCAVAASLGGLLAYRFGFEPLFIVISIVSFMGALFLLLIYNEMIPISEISKKKKK